MSINALISRKKKNLIVSWLWATVASAAFCLIIFSRSDVFAMENSEASLGAYFSALKSHEEFMAPNPDMLIIGDDPADEMFIITDSYRHEGDIRVVNQGSLIVQGPDGTLILKGNILVQDEGIFRVEEGSFIMEQRYWYEHQYVAIDDAAIEFISASLSYSGVPGNAYFSGQSQIVFEDTESDIHATALLEGEALLEISGSSRSIEAILTDGSELFISNSSESILWLGFTEGETADFSFPDTSGNLT